MLLENLTVKEVMRYRTDPESGHLFHSRSEKVKVDIGLMIWVEIGTLYLMRRSMMAKLALVTGLRIQMINGISLNIKKIGQMMASMSHTQMELSILHQTQLKKKRKKRRSLIKKLLKKNLKKIKEKELKLNQQEKILLTLKKKRKEARTRAKVKKMKMKKVMKKNGKTKTIWMRKKPQIIILTKQFNWETKNTQSN